MDVGLLLARVLLEQSVQLEGGGERGAHLAEDLHRAVGGAQPRRPPPDARNELDRLKGAHYARADDDPYWEHDQYDPHVPPPERVVDERYEPPQPEWFSRAGGVYIKNPRAWLNEPRERHDDDRG